MAALDISSLGSEQVQARGIAPPDVAVCVSAAFANRWTAAMLALLDELGAGDESPSLEHTAAVLVRHGARLIADVECAISVVPPGRPDHFYLPAGQGTWGAAPVGG